MNALQPQPQISALKQSLRQFLQQTCTDAELNQWFDPLSIVPDEYGKLVSISFPHAFFHSWFSTHVKDKFEEQISHFLGPGYAIHYHQALLPSATQTASVLTGVKKTDYPFGVDSTFENFLTNQKNYFPWATAKDIVNQKNIQFNPFIVCGGHGSGKSHILKAIANELSKIFDKSLIFCAAVEDMHSIFKSKFKGDVYKARQFFYTFRFLIVDDVHIIKDTPALQEDFIIIFNHFQDHKKQMVFSCPDRAAALTGIQQQLKSRLDSGLSVILKDPDLDIRVKFINHVAKTKKIKLSKNQVLTLAQRCQDFRQLQGLLLKLQALKIIMHKTVLDKDFEQLLESAQEAHAQTLAPQDILDVTAEHFQLSLKTLTGNERRHSTAFARQMAMYLCRHLLGCSYPELGRIFGGKDHTTVMYAVKKIEKLQIDNTDMKLLVTKLTKRCHIAKEK